VAGDPAVLIVDLDPP